MDHLKLTVDALSVDTISELVVDDSCGAVSIFVGTTRDNFEGKKVVRLEYEAYEAMTLKAMKSICDEARRQWPALHGIAIHHRLGNVGCREASVVIAVSSPHRRDALDAAAQLIESLKESVPIWKREVYDSGAGAAWKENRECPSYSKLDRIDSNLVQLNVSNEELERRIQNFMESKREQVNVSNVHDFTPGLRGTGDVAMCSASGESGTEDETCARVRMQYVRRSGSKGHLKIRKVNNEWGPQTVASSAFHKTEPLPSSIAERVLSVERFLHLGPVAPDVYRRLKAMEDKIACLQAMSPEYANFWKNNKATDETKQEPAADYTFSADDIARKIEELERHGT